MLSRSSTTGVLSQLPAELGCVRQTGAEGCTNGKGLPGPRDVEVSPDGKHVYALGDGNTIAAFARNLVNGALTQLGGMDGCLAQLGGVSCRDVRAMAAASDLALSPDGRHVYVAAAGSDAVTVLRRDETTGVLSQDSGDGGCISRTGEPACRLASAFVGLDAPTHLAVADDAVFVASQTSDTLDRLSRDRDTGALIGDACAGPSCPFGSSLPLDQPFGVALSPADGNRGADTGITRDVYVASRGNSAVAFADEVLNAQDIFVQCVQDESGSDQCRTSRALALAREVVVSPDGLHVYVLSEGADAVAIFERELAPRCDAARVGLVGLARAPLVPFETPTTVELPCQDPNGDPVTFALAPNPAHGTLSELHVEEPGSVVYTPDAGFLGPDRFEIVVSDGANSAFPDFEVEVVGRPGQPVCQPADVDLGDLPGNVAAVEIPLGCRDPAGQPLTHTILTPPTQGTLDLNATDATGSVVYTLPASSPEAFDTFTYQASDGDQASNVATIHVGLPNARLDRIGPDIRPRSAQVLPSGTLTVEVGCPRGEPRGCTDFVGLQLDLRGAKRRGLRVVTEAFGMETGGSTRVHLDLPKRLRRLLARRGVLPMILEVSGRDALGNASRRSFPSRVLEVGDAVLEVGDGVSTD